MGKEKVKERGGDTADEARSWPAREGAMEVTTVVGRGRHYSPEVGIGGGGPLELRLPLWSGVSVVESGLIIVPLGSPALAPPQHCIQLTPPHYLLHESKLFWPARAQRLFPGKHTGPELDFYFISTNKSHLILYLGKAGWQQ